MVYFLRRSNSEQTLLWNLSFKRSASPSLTAKKNFAFPCLTFS